MSIFTAFGSVDSPQQWINCLGGNVNSYPTTGTTLFDVSGNNLNGTLAGGPAYNSNNGGYITFDGVNDWVDFGYASKPAGTVYDQTSYSWGGWFLLPTSGTTYIPFMCKGGPNTTTYGWSLALGRLNGTTFQASIVTTNAANSISGQAGTNANVTNPTGNIAANTWYFVFATLDWGNAQGNSAGTRRLTAYVANNTTKTVVAGTPATTTQAWLRGSIVNGWNMGQNTVNSPSTTYYAFSTGNIEVYTGIALSAQQVAEVYNKNKGLYGY
ncbi:hypothetical protein UFOVP185_47 [uncultured Caudovirales phage]|uniref:Concanavalin A-like lectin/glucanases superfamily n=1 Tax=uncultured Caudovirales phage TaxID=2100421 RepID=A0A6J7WGS2_9CAUD|nr:hypothetical protein UFOVP185_47 [uncultured Caudovirales phage]